MNGKTIKIISIALIVLVLIAVAAILYRPAILSLGHPHDYQEINKKGVLRVTSEYSSNSVYIDADSLQGFYYELANCFANEKGWKLEVIPQNQLEAQKQLLLDGKCDLIITGILNIYESQDSSISYTQPIIVDKQILVQHKAESANDSNYIKTQLQLANKVLCIPEQSPAMFRIRNLSQEIGDTIYIQEIKRYGSEQLMALAAHKNIKYAVCDERTVKANIAQFPQLDMNTDISFNQFYSWGVSREQPELLDSLNSWIERFKNTEKYKQLEKKYYK